MSPNQQKQWKILGWWEQKWDDSINLLVPEDNVFCWENATEAQLNAASSLCYTRTTWNDNVVRQHHVICGNCMVSILIY